MVETEAEERDTKPNASNVTMDDFYYQSPVTNNKQGEIANVLDERRISSDILGKTINRFNGLMIQSTSNNSAY